MGINTLHKRDSDNNNNNNNNNNNHKSRCLDDSKKHQVNSGEKKCLSLCRFPGSAACPSGNGKLEESSASGAKKVK
jgi:hypothetical protein